MRDMQQLLDRCIDLSTKVAALGTPGQTMLAVVDPSFQLIKQQLRLEDTGKLDPAVWQELTEDIRTSLRQRMTTITEILQHTTGIEEPPEPSNIMYRAYASNFWIVGLTALGILLTVVVLGGIGHYWNKATIELPTGQTPIPPTEGHVFLMIILMGALGGCLHWTSSLAIYIGNGQLFRRWIPYYILMPFEGAALATLIYLLIRTGVLSPEANPPAIGDTGRLKLLYLYAFAGLTGLFARQAIEMLAEVFATIFAKIRAKDPVPAGSGGAASTGQAS